MVATKAVNPAGTGWMPRSIVVMMNTHTIQTQTQTPNSFTLIAAAVSELLEPYVKMQLLDTRPSTEMIHCTHAEVDNQTDDYSGRDNHAAPKQKQFHVLQAQLG